MSEMREGVKPYNHIGLEEYLTEKRLMAARCRNCGAVLLPPRPMCPKCYQAEMEWVELAGEGVLEGYTIVYVGLPGMVEAGYDRQHPYCSGVVRLKEGPAVSAQIVEEDLEGVRVGMAMRAVFIERGGQMVLGFEEEKRT